MSEIWSERDDIVANQYRTKIIVYRMVYLWAGIIFPIAGIIYRSLALQSEEIIILRILHPVVAILLFGLSYKRDFARKYLENLTIIFIYSFTAWMFVLNIMNNFEISIYLVYLIIVMFISNTFFDSKKLSIFIMVVITITSIGVITSDNLTGYKLFSTSVFTVVLTTMFLIVNQKIKLERQNMYFSYYDSLTKLPNRKMAESMIELFSYEAKRENKMFGVIFINFDNFKYVNTSMGHEIGDLILIDISKRLRKCIRKEDFIARVGGDEFIVLLSNISSSEQVSPVLNRIIAAFSEPFTEGKKSIHITTSGGIALFPKDGNNFEALLKNTSIAMYQAKESGGNTFRYFSKKLNERFVGVLEMKEEILNAIENREFVFHYQPKIDIKSGALVGCEALIRWQHPEKGLLYPDKFIDIAEQYDLIKNIDILVIEEVCKQIKKWTDKGLNPQNVAINISASQFNNSEFLDILDSTLINTGVEETLINLEITETTAMKNINHTKAILEKIRSKGISISLDDFGTKYSSLNYLKSFPIDVLKIDKSFIDGIVDNEVEKTILLSIINIAKALNIKVVAEGVETEEQLRILRNYNCEECQGYLFSKPVEANKLEELMLKKHKQVV